MASDREYLDFVLEQLSELENISSRPMMGEYILYYRDRIIGGVYDDRFLVKLTEASLTMMPDAERAVPYEGAKEMLTVEDIENREFLAELIRAMYPEVPERKRKGSITAKK